MRAAVDADLDVCARVAEQVDPLACRELAALVLERDLLLAAAELRLLAAGMDVLGEPLHPGVLTALHLVGRLRGFPLVLGLVGGSH